MIDNLLKIMEISMQLQIESSHFSTVFRITMQRPIILLGSRSIVTYLNGESQHALLHLFHLLIYNYFNSCLLCFIRLHMENTKLCEN